MVDDADMIDLVEEEIREFLTKKDLTVQVLLLSEVQDLRS
jgi:translation elongation factor EF-Tu-like GTPase